MPAFTYVDQPDRILAAFDSDRVLGADTEFMRERTFYSQLCLVQLATRDGIYCVDALSDAGMDEFWSVLRERSWVLHSARQDIEVIYHTARMMPASIFDTQIAAGLLGITPQIGYAGLVSELFDVELPKSHTRANWAARPISAEHLEYAAEDVEYLLPAYDELTERLDSIGRLDWARSDSAWLLNPALYDVDPKRAIERVRGARNLKGRQRAAAARLAAWREREAADRDRPRQWILRDSVLVEIAGRLPESRRQLSRIPALPPRVVQRSGQKILAAIASSAADDRDYLPPRPPDEEQKSLLKKMQRLVAACAGELGIAAETIASKKELSAVIIGGVRDSRLFDGWRRELVGEELSQLL